MSQLIQAQLSGALGFKRLDVPALLELCRYGASLGLPAAANCMGGLYDEAQGLPRDAARSLGWHLRAARGGFTNSQHDIGSMAYTGSRGFKHEALGIYWLQRAAALGHAFAKRKLEQQISLPPPPQGCEGKPALARVTTL